MILMLTVKYLNAISLAILSMFGHVLHLILNDLDMRVNDPAQISTIALALCLINHGTALNKKRVLLTIEPY